MLGALCAALIGLTFAAARGAAADTGPPAAASRSAGAPILTVNGGAIRGVAVPGGYAFRGLPYAAPPVGNQRWKAPEPPADWKGVRDATQFAPSCPQTPGPFIPPPPLDEDCLYLNVSTPMPLSGHGGGRPVLVWIHGGGLTQDAGRNYDGSELAADGIVVVTINYRLGALGFLAHPALASRSGGPTGNYGLMDQQAALRWVQRNIAQFGGDPHDVTIAGQSAGGLSVLAQLVSHGSRALFQRAIVQSGAFALTQQPLADAEVAGEAFAANAGCPDQTAACLRHLSVAALVRKFPGAAIPGVIDGKVLTESIGTALAAGRFARVPMLNGINHDEEMIFTAGLGVAVSGGSFVPVPAAVTPESYQRDIAAVLGVSPERAGVIAAEYPLSAYSSAPVAFSTLVSDENFACPALQVDRWTSTRVPTFGYQFNDDNAPQRFASPGALPALATHSSEIQYLFDQPNAPVPGTLNADEEALAATMRAGWASFAGDGNPSTETLRWPSFADGAAVMSLAPPQPQVETGFSAIHHCSFWFDVTSPSEPPAT
jgi:para-nitrobenzyl esterase